MWLVTESLNKTLSKRCFRLLGSDFRWCFKMVDISCKECSRESLNAIGHFWCAVLNRLWSAYIASITSIACLAYAPSRVPSHKPNTVIGLRDGLSGSHNKPDQKEACICKVPWLDIWKLSQETWPLITSHTGEITIDFKTQFQHTNAYRAAERSYKVLKVRSW